MRRMVGYEPRLAALGVLLVGWVVAAMAGRGVQATLLQPNRVAGGVSGRVLVDNGTTAAWASSIGAGAVPSLDASKIGSGTLDVARLPDLPTQAGYVAPHKVFAANPLLTTAPDWRTLVASDIPSPAGDVTGSFATTVVSKINGNSVPSGVVAGDLLYGSGASALGRLARGTDGQYLKLASGLPVWGNGASAAGGSSGQVQYNSGGSLAGSGNLTVGTNTVGVMATAAGTAPFTVTGIAGQTADYMTVTDSSANEIFKVNGATIGVFAPTGSSALRSALSYFRNAGAIGNVSFGTQYGGAFYQGATIQAVGEESQDSGHMGTRIDFLLTPIGGSTTTSPRFRVTSLGNIVCNPSGAALATTATDGFIYLPAMSGSASATPTSIAGAVATSFDSSSNTLQVYNGGLKKVTLGGLTTTITYVKPLGGTGVLGFSNGVLTSSS